MVDTHSVAAGLDYVGISPILAHLHDLKRVRFEAANDQEVKDALSLTMKKEGLIPALESSHAFVTAYKEAPKMSKDEVILISMSGRGDKDIFTIAEALGDERWEEFLREKVESQNA
jgi:tryptophan synthase beta chain